MAFGTPKLVEAPRVDADVLMRKDYLAEGRAFPRSAPRPSQAARPSADNRYRCAHHHFPDLLAGETATGQHLLTFSEFAGSQ